MSAADKIVPLADLTDKLSEIRQGKQVVHCHGVFDLLHIGHIRHLQEAKGFGDLLVVTVTPDHFVNKGPGRPEFNDRLRAEALAALDVVDYVAVNEWPTAVEAIKTIKPDLYVKGPDYKDPGDDRTGGIGLEEDAVRSVGGHMAVTDDITFSSSRLINQHLAPFPDDVKAYLLGFSERHGVDQVLGWLDRTKSSSVLIVGEAIIDEYFYCEALGKSSKEPVLAVRSVSSERHAGGVLAAANHAASFADRVGVLTVLGDENDQEGFVKDRLAPNVEAHLLMRHDAPTIVKRRYVDNYYYAKLLEVYDMNDEVLPPPLEEDLCQLLEQLVPMFDAVIVIDYGHGMLSARAIDVICRKARFLAVNAQANAANMGFNTVSRYPRADLVCLAEKEILLEGRDRHADIERVMLDVSERLSADQIIVTRGKAGCVVYRRGEGTFRIPALAREVVDRVGAGDAFLSIVAPCVALGAPMETAGFIGNAAAAQAVGMVGNRFAVQGDQLRRHIEVLMK